MATNKQPRQQRAPHHFENLANADIGWVFDPTGLI
jgi:hypothetical protein